MMPKGQDGFFWDKRRVSPAMGALFSCFIEEKNAKENGV